MNKRFALFSLIVYSGESAAFLGVVTLELLIGPQYAKSKHVPSGRINLNNFISFETLSYISAPLLKPHYHRESAMAPTIPMPSALTFELIARCSVIVPTIHPNRKSSPGPDHQSSSSNPYPSSWTSPITPVHASRNASLTQRADAATAGGDRLPIMFEQHIPSWIEAWARSAAESWRGA
jgi:hypothetical protein